MKSQIIITAIAALLIASCKSDLTNNQISISGLSYSPKSINVTMGTTVTWIDNEAVTYTVTSDKGVFDSKDLTKGKSFKYTFITPGTYTYHSIHHPGMTGTVIVSTIPSNGPGYAY